MVIGDTEVSRDLVLVLPARTQPNCISKAVGEPGGPDRRPFNITSE